VAFHSELTAWLMPPMAQAEWLTLTSLLDKLPDDQVPCRADPAAWWPDRKHLDSEATRGAADACRRCPAHGACLDYALAADERDGVWGGTMPAERREIHLLSAA
jgi:hypothetical protein